jgi:hypothetical protein
MCLPPLARLRRTGWTRPPALDGYVGLELVEAQVGGGHHFCQHDDLAGVHRNGKRNHNRFPFICLQTPLMSVDGLLTGFESTHYYCYSFFPERITYN